MPLNNQTTCPHCLKEVPLAKRPYYLGDELWICFDCQTKIPEGSPNPEEWDYYTVRGRCVENLIRKGGLLMVYKDYNGNPVPTVVDFTHHMPDLCPEENSQ